MLHDKVTEQISELQTNSGSNQMRSASGLRFRSVIKSFYYYTERTNYIYRVFIVIPKKVIIFAEFYNV